MKHIFRKILRKSYSKNPLTRFSSVFLGLLSGFSVFYFLYAFGAYDIQKGFSYSGHSLLFRSICFGVLTSTYFIIFETWFKSKLNISGYKQEFIWYTSLIILGSHLIFILFNYCSL